MEFLIGTALIGRIPSFVAQEKCRSFGRWWLSGAALLIVALPHARMTKPVQTVLRGGVS